MEDFYTRSIHSKRY